MNPITIASVTGVSIQTASNFLQAPNSAQKTIIDNFFEKLTKTEQDLTAIGRRENIQRYFFFIINQVAQEPNPLKVNRWANATIQLVTEFHNFDFKDNFIRSLKQLTILDLLVLERIYATEFNKPYIIIPQLIDSFQPRNINQDIVVQSCKQLAFHNLIKEVGAIKNQTEIKASSNLYYVKNQLGPQFINFIS